MTDLSVERKQPESTRLSASEINAILGDRVTEAQVAVLHGFIEQVGGVEEAKQAMAALQQLAKKAA